MNFKIIDNGKEIECEILLTFKAEKTNISYIVYTDGTKDANDEFEIYASRYSKKGNDFILEAIENEHEWDLIDEMLEAKFKEND